VSVSARKANTGSVEISVADTGIGIKQEDIPRLFQEFTQLESAYTKNYEGTGLGLVLTKKLIELHNGRILVESEFGKGSRFSFIIPVKHTAKTGLAPAKPEIKCRILSSVKTALVIDDDPTSIELIDRTLTAEGYKVDRALNGREGIEKARMLLPDLIVLDLFMPGINGFDAADMLKADRKTSDIPIIVLSAADLSQQDKKKLEGKAAYIAHKGSITREGFAAEIKKMTGE